MADIEEYCLSWDEFHRDTRNLARQLLGDACSGRWRGLICITRGGLVPGAILARELEMRWIDTLCLASYDHTRQGDMQVLKGIEGDGEGLLIVDDLVDTGGTARLVREQLPAATLVAVYAKPKGKPLVHHYARDFEQHVWLHFPWDCDVRFSPPMATGKI